MIQLYTIIFRNAESILCDLLMTFPMVDRMMNFYLNY